MLLRLVHPGPAALRLGAGDPSPDPPRPPSLRAPAAGRPPGGDTGFLAEPHLGAPHPGTPTPPWARGCTRVRCRPHLAPGIVGPWEGRRLNLILRRKARGIPSSQGNAAFKASATESASCVRTRLPRPGPTQQSPASRTDLLSNGLPFLSRARLTCCALRGANPVASGGRLRGNPGLHERGTHSPRKRQVLPRMKIISAQL